MLILLAVIIILQLFLTIAFGNAAHAGSILGFTALIVAPAVLLQFILIEIVWYNRENQQRKVHMHQYVFCTTLICLSAIALFDTGVFDFGVFVYYVFILHALSFAYISELDSTNYC